MILDNHGREINYLRLAITDRCNLRCFYCMPQSRSRSKYNKKIGFNSDFNEVTIHYSDKNKEILSYKKKSEISDEIVDRIINQLN